MLLKEWKSDTVAKSGHGGSLRNYVFVRMQYGNCEEKVGQRGPAEGSAQKLSECQIPANNNGPYFPSTS